MNAPQPVCAVCMHPRPGRHQVRCTVGLDVLFGIIDERRPLVSIERTQSNALGEGAAPGFESTPPIDLTARTLQDYASLPWRVGPDDVDRPTLSASRTLGYWQAEAAKAGGDYRDGWWVIYQPWIAEMVADLRTLAGQLLAATGDPAPVPIGYCLEVVDPDPGPNLPPIRCGEPLFMPDSSPLGVEPEVRCPHPDCTARYTGGDLIRVKLIAEQDGHPPPVELRSSVEGTPQRCAYGLHHDWVYPMVEFPAGAADLGATG